MKYFEVTASALIIRETPGGRDTQLRLIRGQRVEAFGKSFDGSWLFIHGPSGTGWSSAAHLQETSATPVRDWPKVPHGLVELRAIFGDPRPHIQPNGGVAAQWERQVLAGRCTLPGSLPLGWDLQTRVSRISCHPLIAEPLESVFAEIHRRGFWGLLHTYDGCYNWRNARGLQKLSTHAWAIAVDLNAATNRLGHKPQLDGRIVSVFEDHGFLWGGRWSRPDGMHFQYVTGY